MRGKQIRDVIYKYVQIPGRLMQVVDTPEFQRLRRIRQLGFVHYVYPSANHTRFEHSLGACHLGGVALKMLNEQQPELLISPLLVESIQLALLTHDLGHTAFSHLFDHEVAPHLDIPEEMKTHESRSILLLRHMNQKYTLGFSQAQLDLVANLILGTPMPLYPPWIFLFCCNKAFDFDLDKLDYLVRDSYAIGMPRDLQIERIFAHMRVVNNSTLAFHSKVAELIVDVFRHRAKMHSEVYRHRVNIAFDHIGAQMLRNLEQDWKSLFSDTTHHSWSQITDDILFSSPSCSVLLNQLQHRKHPKSRVMHSSSTTEKQEEKENEKKTEIKTQKTVQVVIGFTSKLLDNPLARIQCFDSFDHPTQLKSLLECGISEISSTTPGQQVTVVLN